MNPDARVVSVSASSTHSFSEQRQLSIRLIAGHGVDGDSHAGATVQHRSRLKWFHDQPNLRQVHLIHSELHEELRELGFAIKPGEMGENITTLGLDLLGLTTGVQLAIGPTAVVEITGLRNPCKQLDRFQAGLKEATLGRNAEGELIRKAGVMGLVLEDGIVRPNDLIVVLKLPEQASPLQPV